MWEAAQLEMKRRKDFAETYRVQKVDYGLKDNPFAGKIICGQYGSIFGRKVWNSTNELKRRRVWRCNNKYVTKGKKGCNNKHLDDGAIYKIFINAYNAIIENEEYFINQWRELEKSGNELQRYKAKQFTRIIEKANKIEEFDENLLFKFVERITVFSKEKVIVTLLEGINIEVVIE